MKLLFLLTFLSVPACYLPAQAQISHDVPQKISAAFHQKYPSFTASAWSLKNNLYSAKFIAQGKKSTADFDANGIWTSTKTVFSSLRKLPVDVKNAFHKSQFSNWYIEKINEDESAEVTIYEVIVDNGNLLDGDHHDVFLEKYLLVFSNEGTLMRKALIE